MRGFLKMDIMQVLTKMAFLLWLLSANSLFSQNFQWAGINYSHHAKTKVEDSPTGAELESRVLGAFVKLPVKFKNQKTILMNTLRFAEVRQISYNSPLFVDAKSQKDLYLLSISPMLIHGLGKKWSIIAGCTPTLASDLKEKLSGDDFLIQASLLASAKLNEKWTLGGGLVYTTQFGDPRFLPALQLRYLHNRHFVNVLLPSYMHYQYRFGQQEKLRLGIRIETNGGNFNINNRDYTEVFPNTINKLIYSRVNMGGIVNFQLTETIQIEAFGGLGAARKFKLKDRSNMIFSADAEKGVFFNLGIILTVPAKAGAEGVEN